MLFNSQVFFLFLSLFAVAYFLSHGRLRLWVICLASYFFYGWWDWRFMGLLFGMTVICWYSAIRLTDAVDQRRRNYWMVVAIASCLTILGFFKYFNFFQANAVVLLALLGVKASWPTIHIVLPIGISFFMFQGLSYVVDVARGDLPVERSLLKVATFKAFFPQLVAGPIVRAHDFMPQLHSDRRPTANDLIIGVCLMAWGYVMKVGMADSLAAIVDQRFQAPLAQSPVDMLIGVLFYAFQIYGDFGGYSLIAIGVARCFGFHFLLNFKRPYFADSFSDFWRRWHISLSSWLRDYLYIPLGGNRGSEAKTYRNLTLTMLLGGLWHGAAWNFVFWGALHGSYLSLERMFRPKMPVVWPLGRVGQWGKRLLSMTVVFLWVCVAWVLFRTASVGDAWCVFSKIASPDVFDISAMTSKLQVCKGFFLIGIVVIGDIIWSGADLEAFVLRHTWLCGAFVAFCCLAISLLGTFYGNSFIYFQF